MTFFYPVDDMVNRVTQRWGAGAWGPLGRGGHPGVDIGEGVGTQLRACADYEVLYAGPATDFGNHAICLYYPALKASTTMGHCSAHFVQTGWKGKAGDVVGLTGNEGDSTGPHLHFETRLIRQPFGGNPPNVDPMAWLAFFSALDKKPIEKPKPISGPEQQRIRKIQASIGVAASGHWDHSLDARIQTLRFKYLTPPRNVHNDQQVKGFQKALDITVDGTWGPKTEASWNLYALIYRGR